MSAIRFLLLNLPGFEHAVSSVSINLGIATIAAMVRRSGNNVETLDLNLYKNYLNVLQNKIDDVEPQFIGFNICTPQFDIAKKLSKFIKSTDEKICIICGGPHATALPVEVLKKTSIDVIVLGEGDYTILEILQNYPNKLEEVKGICFKRDKEIIRTINRPLIKKLDLLPYPALDLFEVEKYIYPPQSCKKNPVGLIETSRGCPGKCIFCSRLIGGRVCRFKSPERVVEEIIYAKSVGFNEIHFVDDNFTTNIKRAIEICNLLIENNINIPWIPRSGIRVDYINRELFKKMVEAECYHIPFGIESTSQKVLNICNKGITVEQIKNAIRMAKDFGFEVTGYFMIGLPEQTSEDIKRDIEFAEKMDLDFVKFGATIPYPGTPLFYRWKQENRILTFDWSRYHYATNPFEIYVHPYLSIEDLDRIEIGNRRLTDVLNLVLDKNFLPIIDPAYTDKGDENGKE
jgi:radical SAM superfamily enzyme YgiQ (UPF0313 family)